MIKKGYRRPKGPIAKASEDMTPKEKQAVRAAEFGAAIWGVFRDSAESLHSERYVRKIVGLLVAWNSSEMGAILKTAEKAEALQETMRLNNQILRTQQKQDTADLKLLSTTQATEIEKLKAEGQKMRASLRKCSDALEAARGENREKRSKARADAEFSRLHPESAQ